MGTAILEGIVSQKVIPTENIFISDIRKSVLKRIKNSGVNICNNKKVVENSNVIILAVKPQDIEAVSYTHLTLPTTPYV